MTEFVITPNRKITRATVIAYENLVVLLDEGVYNCRELAARTGLHYTSVRTLTRQMWLAGHVHIHAWETDARDRDLIKIYKLGPGKDARRRRLTGAERQRAYNARIRSPLHRLQAALRQTLTQRL